jgi:GTP-binding protein
MPLPVIALVGRPNVGKSTLFNRLTRTRDALVADFPGLTRDRQYGLGKVGSRPYLVVDTGGLAGAGEELDGLIERQAWQAIEAADAVVFLVDGRAGLSASDESIAAQLRRCGKAVFLAVNKTEHLDPDLAVVDFQSLGLGSPRALAAAHNRGVKQLVEAVLTALPDTDEVQPSDGAPGADGIRLAIVGRPNVGKSTLVNRLLGEERVVASDRPGTTRDSVRVPFTRDGVGYLLIDTAGVRRRARVKETIEKFSVIKTLQAIEQANVVIMVLDARQGLSEQDATLLGFVLDCGRALVVAVNKWDGLERDQRSRVRAELDRRFPYLEFARTHFVSALHGSGVMDLLGSVRVAHQAALRDLPTPELTRVLQDAVQSHQPPMVRGRRIKLRYAHQGGRNPPLIVIHGNQTGKVPEAYRRYLMKVFRRVFRLSGTPVRIEFKSGGNPFDTRPGRRRQ